MRRHLVLQLLFSVFAQNYATIPQVDGLHAEQRSQPDVSKTNHKKICSISWYSVSSPGKVKMDWPCIWQIRVSGYGGKCVLFQVAHCHLTLYVAVIRLWDLAPHHLTVKILRQEQYFPLVFGSSVQYFMVPYKEYAECGMMFKDTLMRNSQIQDRIE